MMTRFSSSGIGDYVVVHTDLLKGRAEDLKPDPYLRKSPSLESLSRPPSLGFASTRLLSASTGGLKPQSKLRYRIFGGEKAERHWLERRTLPFVLSPLVDLLLQIFPA